MTPGIFLAGNESERYRGALNLELAERWVDEMVVVDEGATALALSGGNVNARVLAAVINRRQTGIGRRTRVFTTIGERPGSLAELLGVVAAAGGNVIDQTHVRDGVTHGLGETGIELVIESRNDRHAADLLDRLTEAGYAVVTR